MSLELRYAPKAYRMLSGVFCIYKPAEKSFFNTRSSILNKLTKDMNTMEVRPPKEKVYIEGSLSNVDALVSGNASENRLRVEVRRSYSDHPLVVGQRYEAKDFSLKLANYPGWHSSGIIVCFIGRMSFLGDDFSKWMCLRTYEVKGKLGLETNNFLWTGNIIEKSRYHHLRTSYWMDRVLAKLQAAQQSQMYNTLGIDLKTQKAYDLACKGMLRPAEKKTSPVVYGLKCIHFDPPDFTIEVQCINEFEPFLAGLIHTVAHQLKTSAHCNGIRLVKYGPFSVKHALLEKHWNAENIIDNINICTPIYDNYKENISPVIKHENQNESHDKHQQNNHQHDNQESFLDMLKRNKKRRSN